MPSTFFDPMKTVEATVTSKGQVTLPSELRRRLGLQKGSRVRFSMAASGDVKVEPVRNSVSDLWKMADEGGKPEAILSFEEMNMAKVRRQSR